MATAGGIVLEVPPIMKDNWVDDQREVLAAMEERTDALRDRMTPTFTEPVTLAVPPTSPIEHLRSRRKWILIILLWCNGTAVIRSTYTLVTWPSSVKLWLSSEQVRVYQDTDGGPCYWVTLPVKEFPYDIQLQQRLRFQLFGLALINLLLLVGLLHTHWRQSQLAKHGETTATQPGTQDDEGG